MEATLNINDELLKTAIRLSKARTNDEVVTQALENFIRALQQRQLLALRGKVTWDGDLNEMRTSIAPDEWDQ